MRTNQTRKQLLDGKLAAGIFVMANSPHVTGAIAAAGFDFVHYDMEHTPLDFAALENLVRAADTCGITPLVRVASGAKRDILPALEAGAQGIMVPAVESAEEAAAIVQVSRYHPEGRRGMFYMGYRSRYGGLPPADYYAAANRELLLTVQIETVRGVENVAAIAAVPGVDALFIGPGDLSQSLGAPGDWSNPAFHEATNRAIRATRDAGKIAGAMSSTLEQAEEWVERGVRFLSTGLDLGFLRQALSAEASLLKERLRWEGGGPWPE
jgi:4-hydroxy-2-oxoheptanedioate aldolase